MNRREFTASLAAIGFLPGLQITAPVAATAPTVPAGAYAWAHLIARTQTKCSAAMLARQLHLSPDVAAELFRTMIADGVLKVPGATGIARATRPVNATGIDRSISTRIRMYIKATLDDTDAPIDAEVSPLANSDEPCLGCDDTLTEDQTDASTNQSVQENPARR